MPRPYIKLSKKEFKQDAKKYATSKIREKANKGYSEK